VKLRYTLRGAAELDKVLVTIEERSPQGARHVQARIQAIINLLLRYPHAGQPTSKGRLRRVVATPYPYLIFCHVAKDEIIIHGVRHAAREPSSMPG
jgi:toxin ParE1/3/4